MQTRLLGVDACRDFFGGLGPGDLFGFMGNLLYGLVPYKFWEAFTDRPPVPRGVLDSLGLVAVIVVAATLEPCQGCIGGTDAGPIATQVADYFLAK